MKTDVIEAIKRFNASKTKIINMSNHAGNGSSAYFPFEGKVHITMAGNFVVTGYQEGNKSYDLIRIEGRGKEAEIEVKELTLINRVMIKFVLPATDFFSESVVKLFHELKEEA